MLFSARCKAHVAVGKAGVLIGKVGVVFGEGVAFFALAAACRDVAVDMVAFSNYIFAKSN